MRFAEILGARPKGRVSRSVGLYASSGIYNVECRFCLSTANIAPTGLKHTFAWAHGKCNDST